MVLTFESMLIFYLLKKIKSIRMGRKKIPRTESKLKKMNLTVFQINTIATQKGKKRKKEGRVDRSVCFNTAPDDSLFSQD